MSGRRTQIIWLVAALAAAGPALNSAPAWAAAGEIEITGDEPADLGDVTVAPPVDEAGHLRVVPGERPRIYRDVSGLPPAVAATRAELMEAASTGDLEALRPIVEGQPEPPVVTFGGVEDPIDFLRESSTDGEGRELLGILLELLEAPFAVLQQVEEQDLYVWPYLAAVRLDNLTPSELVELYKLVSHYDYESMLDAGGWYFFRIGIRADGSWAFFVAGD